MALTEIPSELSSTPSIADGGNATAITIDSSERVGISNSNPSEMLTIGSTSDTNVRVQFLSSTTGGNTIQFGDGTGAAAYRGYINYTHSDDVLAFATGGSEAMRLSGGNLLVGKTTTAFGTAGAALYASGDNDFVNDGNVMSLNRLNSDGSIINLYKDGGTAVGVIGALGGSLMIGGGDVGIGFYQGSDALVPSNGVTATRDNAIDLGMSDSRFKDIYLSGGVNFSANANAGGMTSETLDDYEEGAWTPTLSGCDSVSFSAQALYIKIGAMVHIQWYSSAFTVANAVSGGARISNLPFTPKAGKYSTAAFAHTQAFTNHDVQAFTNSSNPQLYITSNGNTAGNTWRNGFPMYVMVSCTYYTDL